MSTEENKGPGCLRIFIVAAVVLVLFILFTGMVKDAIGIDLLAIMCVVSIIAVIIAGAK